MRAFAELGAFAYVFWRLVSSVVVVAGPISWFLPKCVLRAHVAILLGDGLLWSAVYLRLAEGLTVGQMAGVWSQFGFIIAFVYVPTLIVDLTLLALKTEPTANSTALLRLPFLAFLVCAPAFSSYLLAPYWFRAVEGAFVENARDTARGRPYCLANLPDSYALFAIRPLLAASQVLHLAGPVGEFRALLVMKTESGSEVRHWSFRAMRFVPAPGTFSLQYLAGSCALVPDPFAFRQFFP